MKPSRKKNDPALPDPALSDPILEVRDLRVWFPVKKGLFSKTAGYVRAVDGVSFDIRRGETLGLVGESGCGKTTLGRAVLGLEKPRSGRVRFLNTEISVPRPRPEIRRLKRKMQMIFQDPMLSLNPRMNVLDIVTEALVEFGMDKALKEERARALLLETGLDPKDLYRYPHEFSGGQRQRISVARAISVKPDFIVCDEIASALDVSVQARVINLMMDLSESHGIAYLFISHDLSVVSAIARRVAVMYLGKIVESGPAADIIGAPMHPYTRALISAVPDPGGGKKKRIVLKGETPSPVSPPPGCVFHTRCPEAINICRKEPPAPWERRERSVWCHLYG
ncbi:oligopeptide transporter subunit; ATP-binding component of ABC superfamily [Candidatus Desulfarcum epimagneticum]|uniref:Oligopeptide transporter subunit ATP-binding component of ABC superfamily n=1 Tax=uncultured Desulfobacteraceae bacterium TaxID=218296 RepID=A0A484HHQ2_9BACT|nr:oligopeptide transporter subunit; ATP-binding component of ABC superfamily [uncultured Desulfobacteraceae bacterium]